jgi:hypothetical protein
MINLNFSSSQECKEYLKTLLEKTDYICLDDVKNELENYQDLVNYRLYIRTIFFEPGCIIKIPEEPTPIWK